MSQIFSVIFTVISSLILRSKGTTCFDAPMQIIGCGFTCYDWTDFGITYPLTLSSGFLTFGNTQSQNVFPSFTNGGIGNFVLFIAKLNDQMAPQYIAGFDEQSGYNFAAGLITNTALSLNEKYFTYIKASNNKCFYVLKVQDGSFVKAFCSDGNELRFNEIMMKDYNETYIFSMNAWPFPTFGKVDLSVAVPTITYMRCFISTGNFFPMSIDQAFYKAPYIYLAIDYADSPGLLKYDPTTYSITSNYLIENTESTPSYTFVSADITATKTRYFMLTSNYFKYDQANLYYALLKESNYDLPTSTFTLQKEFQLTVAGQFLHIAGCYIDPANGQFSIGIFGMNSPGFAAIATVNFNETGTFTKTFKYFYSAQNGYEISFSFFYFKSLNYGILSGGLNYGSGSIIYDTPQGLAINLPEPYYFQMGAPIVSNMEVYSNASQIYHNNNVTIDTFTYNLQNILNPSSSYFHYYGIYGLGQQIIEETGRTITPPTINPIYTYYLGDTSLIINFGVCTYSESCTDTVFTYSLVNTNETTINSAFFVFTPSTRQLFVTSTDQSKVADYSLRFKCNVQDGFISYVDFTVKVLYDGRDLTNFTYLPNYAPMFYEQPKNIKILAGNAALLTLPDHYDLNPTDKVTVSVQTAGKYRRNFFKVVNNQEIEFNAGFSELGDIDIIITLIDNNTKPLSTKYRITATFFANSRNQINNTDVKQNNYSTVVPVVTQIKDENRFKVDKITPLGQMTLKFENKLNLTNMTELKIQLKKALQIGFDDPSIEFDWDFTSIGSQEIKIQLNFKNPIQISQSSRGSQLQISLLQPGLFINTQTNSSAIIYSRMPPQLPSQDKGLMLKMTAFFNTTLQSILITQVGVQIVISQSLQVLWGFVNTQQIISHIPLLDLGIPANLYYFFLLVVGSLKFDFLFSSEAIQNAFKLDDDYPAFNENFRNFGYDSSLAVQNMGFNTFILMLSPILIFVSRTAVTLSRIFPKQLFLKFFKYFLEQRKQQISLKSISCIVFQLDS
eukprot:403362188